MSVQSIGFKPLLWKKDYWDKLSVLKLSEQDREQRLGCFAEDRLPVPVLWEAWVEHQAFEPCPQVLFCAGLPTTWSLPCTAAPAPQLPSCEPRVPSGSVCHTSGGHCEGCAASSAALGPAWHHCLRIRTCCQSHPRPHRWQLAQRLPTILREPHGLPLAGNKTKG